MPWENLILITSWIELIDLFLKFLLTCICRLRNFDSDGKLQLKQRSTSSSLFFEAATTQALIKSWSKVDQADIRLKMFRQKSIKLRSIWCATLIWINQKLIDLGMWLWSKVDLEWCKFCLNLDLEVGLEVCQLWVLSCFTSSRSDLLQIEGRWYNLVNFLKQNSIRWFFIFTF